MKTGISTILVGSLMALASTAILADDMPAKSIDMVNILTNLKDQGYVAVHEIKFDDNVYKAEVINSAGNEVKVKIDAQTGKMIESTSKEKENNMSMLDAVKKVEAAGYHNIYAVESEDDGFKMKAVDKDGKKVKINLDLSGNVTSKMD